MVLALVAITHCYLQLIDSLEHFIFFSRNSQRYHRLITLNRPDDGTSLPCLKKYMNSVLGRPGPVMETQPGRAACTLYKRQPPLCSQTISRHYSPLIDRSPRASAASSLLAHARARARTHTGVKRERRVCLHWIKGSRSTNQSKRPSQSKSNARKWTA